MEIKSGVDLVHIPRFEQLMQNESFIKKVFHSSEIKDYRREHLAGVFAAKEAFFKALNHKHPDWLMVEIKKQKSGKPFLVLANGLKEKIKTHEMSITHEKDYALAIVIVKVLSK